MNINQKILQLSDVSYSDKLILQTSRGFVSEVIYNYNCHFLTLMHVCLILCFVFISTSSLMTEKYEDISNFKCNNCSDALHNSELWIILQLSETLEQLFQKDLIPSNVYPYVVFKFMVYFLITNDLMIYYTGFCLWNRASWRFRYQTTPECTPCSPPQPCSQTSGKSAILIIYLTKDKEDNPNMK